MRRLKYFYTHILNFIYAPSRNIRISLFYYLCTHSSNECPLWVTGNIPSLVIRRSRVWFPVEDISDSEHTLNCGSSRSDIIFIWWKAMANYHRITLSMVLRDILIPELKPGYFRWSGPKPDLMNRSDTWPGDLFQLFLTLQPSRNWISISYN